MDLDMEPSEDRLKSPIAKFQACARVRSCLHKLTAKDQLIRREVVQFAFYRAQRRLSGWDGPCLQSHRLWALFRKCRGGHNFGSRKVVNTRE